MTWLSNTFRFCIVSFACVFLVGCGNPGDTYGSKAQTLMTELATTLDSIQDEKSCAAALPTVDRIVKDVKANNADIKKLELSTEQKREIDEKYPNKENAQKIWNAAAKLTVMAESNAEFKLRYEKLKNSLLSVDPNFAVKPAAPAEAK